MYKYDFKVFPILILVLYVPFHLIEEGLNKFPEWMSEFYGLPIVLSYPHWLINNLFFFITLTIGLILFLKNKKFLFLGIGILIWAILNALEHIVGTFMYSRVSPGLFTGLLFLLVAIFGLLKLKRDNVLNKRLVLQSVLASFLFWIIPIGIIILTGNIWLKILY